MLKIAARNLAFFTAHLMRRLEYKIAILFYSVINSVLSNRSVISLEKDLQILQEMIENRWETLNKIDKASKNE